MMKVRKTALLAAFFVIICTVSIWSDVTGTSPSVDNTVEERLIRLERSAGSAHTSLVSFDAAKSTLHLKSLEWGLLLEAEGSFLDAGGNAVSDLVLATVEFRTDAQVNDWLSGHVCLLWEEDDTEENSLDEGYIVVGRTFYLQAGKYYLPFGNFETAFVSDPLTLELAEINRSSAQTGFGNEWFGVCAGAFKGDDEETVDSIYAAAGISLPSNVEFGAYWLSDLLETDGLADLNDDLDQRESGAGAYVNFYLGPVTTNVEVISALNEYDIGGESYTPMAYNIETSTAFAEKWTVGIKVEGSEDFYMEYDGINLTGKFHKTGYGTVVSYGFHENAAVSAEYLRLEDLNGGENGDLMTLQLALEI